MTQPFRRPSQGSLLALALLVLAAPAAAQYKVVGPDGRVTYTDRPPAPDGKARISALNRRASAPEASPTAGWPIELRQTAERYPVTLYTAGDCGPCDTARAYLRERGVPYSERQVQNDADALALERLVGARTVPSLRIGAQSLNGYDNTEWASYLDAAGYPAQSRLPAGWTPPPPSPLVARAPAPRAPAPEAPPQEAPIGDLPAEQPGNVIRF